MSHSTSTPDTAPSPWWWPPWTTAPLTQLGGPFAPQWLNQPILSGWTVGSIITVNQKNSRDPETEQAIVAEDSYGRQLGMVMDALATLIADRPKTAPARPAFDKLLALRTKIEGIKKATLAHRVNRLEQELSRLQQESPESWDRLARLIKRLNRQG